MSSARATRAAGAAYSLGIDLGTTHCALSYLALDSRQGRGPAQAVLPVPQLTAPGTVDVRQLLPSFWYLPHTAEFPQGALGVPWDKTSSDVVGELARAHGAKVPTRLISSAKSWLCHSRVDRRAAILPWGAPDEVSKHSPLEASARYLAHLKGAWDVAFPAHSLKAQRVVVTVPASFDAGARDLTVEACQLAGFPEVTLLEEPQAALYAWLEAHGEGWRKLLKPKDVILVVDVGGGTSDFSLIEVAEQQGELTLERRAVGDHILLGGDNMDLALAHAMADKLKQKPDGTQLIALTYACRAAKEALFADEKLAGVPVAVAGRGSSLIGGTLKTTLERSELTALLTDGFFPRSRVEESPAADRRSGLQQLGLPYAQDPGITRHLGAFLVRQAALSPGAGFARPTAVLFNGGVFKAAPLRSRMMEVLSGWLGAAPRELPGADLDLSVARGAAYYGWVREGHGIRIRGGTARSYYVGVESSVPAVPGRAPPVKALCVAPLGMEEGTQAEVPPQQFGLVVGEPTRFRFFASSVRREDKVGTTLDDVDELEELAPIETALEGKNSDAVVPVNLQAAVTELGSLELRCLEKGGKGKWKLELNVRQLDS